MRRSTKQLPLSGEFTKHGKEVVNYGWNFLTFVARESHEQRRPSIPRKRGGDIPPKFV
jgi:hypothetical protein